MVHVTRDDDVASSLGYPIHLNDDYSYFKMAIFWSYGFLFESAHVYKDHTYHQLIDANTFQRNVSHVMANNATNFHIRLHMEKGHVKKPCSRLAPPSRKWVDFLDSLRQSKKWYSSSPQDVKIRWTFARVPVNVHREVASITKAQRQAFMRRRYSIHESALHPVNPAREKAHATMLPINFFLQIICKKEKWRRLVPNTHILSNPKHGVRLRGNSYTLAHFRILMYRQKRKKTRHDVYSNL